jgi:hypothetical protein
MSDRKSRRFPLIAFGVLVLASLAAVSGAVAAVAQGNNAADTNSAASMRTRYAEYQAFLGDNQFGKPLHLISHEGNGDLKGDAYAIVEHPFAKVDGAMSQGVNWCDILILPFNTKHCEVSSRSPDKQVLTIYVGKKGADSLDRAFRIDFQFQPLARTQDYLKRALRADSGPMGTHNYDITFEAAPLDDKRTFIHLAYSYSYGTLSRIAMSTYLNTVGAGKVGFSKQPDESGKPQFVSGMRGVMERNTMRYFLAIEAYLDSLNAPPTAQLAKRINDWFSASEKYPRQLHEMERGEYVALKQKEAQRPGT